MGVEDSDLHGQDHEEARKPYRQILVEEISEGRQALDRPLMGLLLSGISAGLDIGFSLFLMGVMATLVNGRMSEPVAEILIANMSALGFILVVQGRSELFTEHTTLAVLPVLSGQASLGSLGRLWAVVYVANLIGAAVFAGVAVLTGPALGIIDPMAFEQIAARVHEHPAGAMVLSAILAGWLMGLLSWLVTASRDTIGQIVIVWLIATSIGFAHLHHSILGAVEVLAGLFAAQGTTLSDCGRFLAWTTLGNAIGGTVFVAILKYSHATRAGQEAPGPRSKQ